MLECTAQPPYPSCSPERADPRIPTLLRMGRDPGDAHGTLPAPERWEIREIYSHLAS